MAVLVADSIGKRYGNTAVLRSATLRAVQGQVRALLGLNGAGKSTLLRIACGLVPADSGTIRYDGETLLHPRLHRLARRGMFFLPDHDLLSASLTLRAQLEAVAHTFSRADVEAVSSRVGVSHVLEHRTTTLSSGERRRAELAAAFLRRPRCLLADEPLRGIAPVDAEVIVSVFHELAEAACAVVFTSHEVGAILELVDHVTWCTDATTYELGPPAVASRDERFRRHYLGIP